MKRVVSCFLNRIIPLTFCPAASLQMNERIIILLLKSIDDHLLDDEEKKELDDWTHQSPHHLSLYNFLMNREELLAEIKEMLRNASETW
jgi:hypothetical protein